MTYLPSTDDVITEFENYCNRRKEEFVENPWDNDMVKKMNNRLKEYSDSL